MLADITGNGKVDMVGFGNEGVYIEASTGAGFNNYFVLPDFGYNQGWRVARHVRTVADINGDKREDIVGFGDAGVYRSLGTGTSTLGPATFVLADFGYNQGWRVERHVRLLADVNGDGRKDIVAFGDAGVWLSLATSDGNFTAPAFVVANFGYNQGWTPAKHIRTLADVNGDGKADIVGFGDYGVWIALSTGTGFATPQFVLSQFGYSAGGWMIDRHPRILADMNRDGKADIVGFGSDGVWIAYSTGSGFGPAQFMIADFGYNQGWRVNAHPRFVADLNGDGYQDIVGYGEEAVYRALGGPGRFGPVQSVLRDLVVDGPLRSKYPEDFLARAELFPKFVGDVTGDGKADLVAANDDFIMVAASTALPPPPPPNVPTNPRITASSTTSLSIAWNDNSSDERKFFINYHKSGGDWALKIVDANVTTAVLGSLDTDAEYCFNFQAEGLFDI